MMTREEIAAIDRECEKQHISLQEYMDSHGIAKHQYYRVRNSQAKCGLHRTTCDCDGKSKDSAYRPECSLSLQLATPFRRVRQHNRPLPGFFLLTFPTSPRLLYPKAYNPT